MKGLGLFPTRHQVFLLCGTVTTLIYTWMVLTVTQDVAERWRLFLNLHGTVAVYAYSLLASMLEVLVVTSFIVVLSALLPDWAVRQDFEVRGSLIALAALGSLMVLTLQPPEAGPTMRYGDWLAWSAALSVGAVLLAARVAFLRKAVTSLVMRLSVLVYFYGFFTVVSAAYVLARNVLGALQ